MRKLTWMNRILVALVAVNLGLLPLSMQSSPLGIFGPTYAAAQDPDPCDPEYEGEEPCEPGDEEPHYVNCCLSLIDTSDMYCCHTCCDWVDYEGVYCNSDGDCLN